MLKHDLGYHPYKLQIVLQLTEDTELFFNNEAPFKLKRWVNKQNIHYWLADNPNWQITKSLHSQQVTVWCAISQYHIIRPFFFRRQKGTVLQDVSGKFCKNAAKTVKKKMQKIQISNMYSK